jgi:RHS repeat-associated protein
MRRIATLLICATLLFSLGEISFAAEKVFYYHTDPVGTAMAISDSTGNVVWRATYKPFGQEQSVSGSLENDERFIGKEKDKETGLVYINHRYYMPEIGRFISPDPLALVDPWTSKVNKEVLLNPQMLNRYAYGLNNPYKYADPNGLWTLSIGVDLSAFLGAFGGGGGTAINLGYSKEEGLSFSMTGTAGGGAVAGAGVNLGIRVVKTNASSVNQLLGTFVEGSRGLGPAAAVVGVAGKSVKGEGIILGLAGKGGPPQASATVTNTSAIFQYDSGNVSVGNSGNGSIWNSGVESSLSQNSAMSVRQRKEGNDVNN